MTEEFPAGKLYGIFGENGAGKSTLLRVIAGLALPTRGMVSRLGTTDLHEVRPQLGYMAHASLLYDEMSGLENVEYFAGLYGIRDRRRCQQAIAEVGLDPALARQVGAYSQGMRQRLSLARAVVHGPRLLLLDEPFSNVDLVSARHMTELLGRMRDAGTTVFVVTHQAAHLEGIADESVWMEAGRVAARAAGIEAARRWLQEMVRA